MRRLEFTRPALFCGVFFAAGLSMAQEVVRCGAGSYASYVPWSFARSARHPGDETRVMQNRPLHLSPEMEERVKAGEPIPTNDWWTDALVNRWTGNLWNYPAKTRVGADGVRVAFPSYWIADGTELKERSALVVGAEGDFKPDAACVAGWHDWDVEIELREGGKRVVATLVQGSPFTWIEASGITLRVAVENPEGLPVRRSAIDGGGEAIIVGDAVYGVWKGTGKAGTWMAIGLAPDEAALAKLAPFATAVIRETAVGWKYDEGGARLETTWRVKTEDIRGTRNGETRPMALQGFHPHHMKRTKPSFACVDGLVWRTPRGKLRVAAGNALSIDYAFPGLVPHWGAIDGGGVFGELLADYAARGTFGGDTYWGGKGLLQMAFAMMGAREAGDEKTFRHAHARLREKLEDWLTWEPGEQNGFFAYVPKWGGLVGESTSYGSDAFNDHHFHYGYFTYAGALLCLVDADFAAKYGPLLKLVAQDYANWDRAERRFPFLRTLSPWAGHSFAGGVGDGNGNGQESSSEAMQGWGGLFLLGLALGDDAMRDAGIFGYALESRAVAEYWFDRDRENIDYSKYTHPYNSNLTCHGVGWWTYFSGDPVWMHAIQWLPDTPALDYLSEDLKFAKWDWETMWKTKEIGGWFEKGRTRDGHETPAVGGESLGNVLLSYLRRHDPQAAARIFDALRERKMGAAVNADTAHMTYWAVHSQLKYGAPDFSVRADYPCARAFVKDGKRTFMAYNCGGRTRKVRFFEVGDGRPAGEVDAVPKCLTTGVVHTKIAALPAEEHVRTLIPRGVAMRDLAEGKKVKVSSCEAAALDGTNLTDGDGTTRWSSAHDDPEPTATIDLGETVELYGAEIAWENAYAAEYALETSSDGRSWRPAGGRRGGFAGVQRVDFAGERARFVRLRGLKKATQYGISMFAWKVFGRTKSAAPTLGLAVEAERAVLKEGAPCRLKARAWLGNGRFRDVEATWASDDVTFDGSVFTPAKDGFAVVRATAGGLSVEKRLPVEEALKAATLAFEPSKIAAAVGEDVKLRLLAKDQFGGALPLKGVKMSVEGPRGAYKTRKGGVFVPLKKGTFVLTARLDGLEAKVEIVAADAENRRKP